MRIIEIIKKISPRMLALVIVLLLVAVVVVVKLLPEKKQRTKFYRATQEAKIEQKETESDKKEPSVPVVEKEKAKEKEILEKQKRFYGSTEETAKLNHEFEKFMKDQKDPGKFQGKEGDKKEGDKEGKPSGKKDESEFQPKPAPLKGQKSGISPSGEFTDKDKEKNALFKQAFSMNVNPGKLLTETQNSKETPPEQKKESDSKGAPLPDYVQKWKFYRGKVSASTTTANVPTVVSVELTEAPLNGAMLVGEGKANQTSDRMIVTFNKLVIEGKSYKANARGYAIDKTDGVASYIKRNDIAQAQIAAVTAMGKTGLEVARSDTTSTQSTMFSSTTTSVKTQNRTKEALLAGGGAAFEAVGKVLDNTYGKLPPIEIILERNSPMLVRFED